MQSEPDLNQGAAGPGAYIMFIYQGEYQRIFTECVNVAPPHSRAPWVCLSGRLGSSCGWVLSLCFQETSAAMCGSDTQLQVTNFD